MKTEIVSYVAVMRHGDYEQPKGVPSALLPHPLTAKGRTQSEEAVERIAELIGHFDLSLHPIIDTSPSLRAWETAEIIRQGFRGDEEPRIDLEEVDTLTERSLGSMANLSIHEIETIMERDPRFRSPIKGWKSNSWYRLPYPGCESLMESGIRVASHLQQRADECQGTGTLKLILGHGASLRHAALCLGLLESSQIPKFSMHHARPILLGKTSKGRWVQLAGDWKPRQEEALD